MTDTLQHVLRAKETMTLAGVPTGFLPVLAADLARAAHGSSKDGRAVLIASDEGAMRALAQLMVFVLAGYNKQMESFFAHNPGLPSRFPIEMTFADYTDEELAYLWRTKSSEASE